MAGLIWDKIGERFYETGVDHGVLYPQKESAYPEGFAWTGLTSVAENPSGAENNPFYADNIKYLNIQGAEDFGATIECYTYPDEWAACNGQKELAPGVMLGQQTRNTFGLSYRTKVGNDTDGLGHGYKLHLIYGATASPSPITYSTVNDSPEPNTFSFELSTTAVPVSGTDADGKPYGAVASLTIDSRTSDSTKLKALEDILYGNGTGTDVKARLPLPDEIAEIMAAA